jgi:perosamine synthetase
MNVPFFRPYFTDEDKKRVLDCINSGWLTTGKYCGELEQTIRQLTGSKYAISFCSATAALHCSMVYQDLQPGDEVIVPSYTFVATASSVSHAGGVPVLCDVRDDLLIDVSCIEKVLTSRTKGVVVVDMAGLANHLDEIRNYCNSKGLFLIEDAAHSIGATYKNKQIGGHGINTCFSFYANKNVTTGEGGMLVTEDAALDTFSRKFRQHGMSVDAWKRFGGIWKPYDVEKFGFKYNLPDINAALGIGQIERIKEITEARVRLATNYSLAFKNVPIKTPQLVDGHAWHLYIIRVNERDKLLSYLEEHEIGVAVHYKPLHQLSVFNLPNTQFPVSTQVYEQALSLPLYPSLTENEQQYVIDTILEFYK